MKVRVEIEALAPRMQDRQEADLGTKVLGVSGDRE